MPMNFVVRQMDAAHAAACTEKVEVVEWRNLTTSPDNPGHGKPLRDDTVKRAHALRQLGMSWMKIAATVGSAESSVRHAVQKRYGDDRKGRSRKKIQRKAK